MRRKTGFNGNWSSPEQIETKSYERDRDRDQSDKSDQTIENHREQRARLVIRRFLEQEIALNNIAPRAAGQKLVVKHSDQKQPGQAREAEANLLHAKENLPADGRSDLDDQVGDDGGTNPPVIRFVESRRHLMTLLRIIKNPHKYPDLDRKFHGCHQN